MTVISVEPLETTYTVDAEANRNYSSSFQVRCDDAKESPITIAGDARLPQWRQRYIWPFPQEAGSTFDNWSFVRGWNIVRSEEKNRGFWLATYNYTTRPIDEDWDWRDDPLNKPEQYAGSFFMADKETNVDRTNKLIKNSAEEERLVSIDDSRDTLVITKNTSTIDYSLRAIMVNRTNNAVYYGYSANVLRLTAWDATRRFYPDPLDPDVLNVYWENRFEFLIDPDDKHQVQFADIGTRFIADATKATGELGRYGYVYSLDSGDRLTKLYLDGSGKELSLPTTGGEPTPVMIDVDAYIEADFTTLPLSGMFPADIIG